MKIIIQNFNLNLIILKVKAKLDGFRKGKVPNDVLEQRYGPSIHADVVNDLIQRSYPKSLAENKLDQLLLLQVDLESEDPSKPISYSAVFEVFPELNLKLVDGQIMKIHLISLKMMILI